MIIDEDLWEEEEEEEEAGEEVDEDDDFWGDGDDSDDDDSDEDSEEEEDDDSDDDDESTSEDSDDDDDDADKKSEKPKPKNKSKDDKPKSRKRKVMRGRQEIEVDFDDEEGLLALISDPIKYKLKIDGAERDYTLEDLIKDAEHRDASHARMRKSSEIVKDHEAKLASLRGDHPKLSDFLRDHMDLDPFKVLLAEQQELIKLHEMRDPESENYDPQEYDRLKEERARADERRKIAREKEAESAKAEKEAEQKRARKFWDDVLAEAKERKLVLGDVTAGVIRQKLQKLENPTPKDLVYEAHREIRDLISGSLPTDAEELAELLGPDRVKAIGKHMVGQGKKKAASGSGKQRKKGKKKPKKMSIDEAMSLDL